MDMLPVLRRRCPAWADHFLEELGLGSGADSSYFRAIMAVADHLNNNNI